MTATRGLHNILRYMPMSSITISGWGTAPTNLENMVDDNPASVTGTGSKVMGSSGDFGYITFDLGSIKTVLVGGRVGLWSTASTTWLFIESSDDNSTWRTGINSNASKASVTEGIVEAISAVMTGRYIRLRFNVGAAATANAKIYEVYAFELLI